MDRQTAEWRTEWGFLYNPLSLLCQISLLILKILSNNQKTVLCLWRSLPPFWVRARRWSARWSYTWPGRDPLTAAQRSGPPQCWSAPPRSWPGRCPHGLPSLPRTSSRQSAGSGTPSHPSGTVALCHTERNYSSSFLGRNVSLQILWL